jgi:GT2 family glycosyltransferase
MLVENNCNFAIIFILFKDYTSLIKLLSNQSRPPQGLRYYVVDNTPEVYKDYELQESLSNCDNVTFINSHTNLGYFGGAEYALRNYPELFNFDYVAISNTDLHYNAVDIFNFLSKFYEKQADVGVIAPQLVKNNGKPLKQLHYTECPTREKYEYLSKIYSNYPIAVLHRIAGDLKRFVGSGRGKINIPRKIFAPHGAFMIFTNAYLFKTKCFLHPTFLFCEEIFVGIECKKAGLSVIYEPKVTYSHVNHGSIGIIPSRQITQYLSQSHAELAKRIF